MFNESLMINEPLINTFTYNDILSMYSKSLLEKIFSISIILLIYTLSNIFLREKLKNYNSILDHMCFVLTLYLVLIIYGYKTGVQI